ASGRTLGLYDFETDTRTEIAPGGDLDGAVIIEPSWSRTDERRIAVRASIGTGLPDIWILDLDDLDNPVNVTNTPTVAESFPCWSPDDSRIAFNAGGFGTGAVTIQVMNADGTGRATLSNEGAYPAWRR
ncbi:MAG TPA: hypothetical protein VFS92_01255, partial [Planctomycetota bacterium]|nr:hypothetical protein [Planctomycetota bacterium]